MKPHTFHGEWNNPIRRGIKNVQTCCGPSAPATDRPVLASGGVSGTGGRVAPGRAGAPPYLGGT